MSAVAKYDPLETYLSRQDGLELELSFADIERMIGTTLPASASRPQWWANETSPDTTHSQRRSWGNAGYDAFLLPGSRVLFRRKAA